LNGMGFTSLMSIIQTRYQRVDDSKSGKIMGLVTKEINHE